MQIYKQVYILQKRSSTIEIIILNSHMLSIERFTFRLLYCRNGKKFVYLAGTIWQHFYHPLYFMNYPN